MSYVEHKKRILENLSGFEHYLAVNRHRNPCKITIKFEGKRGAGNGFASLDITGFNMERILAAIEKEVQEQIKLTNENIRDYERSDNSMGSMDS